MGPLFGEKNLMFQRPNLKAFQRKSDAKRHTSITDFPQAYSDVSSIGLTRFSNYILSKDKICSSVNSAKTVIVGNSGSGKSSLLKLVANKKFDENISPSQEGFVETETISYKIVGNKVKNVIYDITGDPERAPLIEGYFENISAAIITFDLTNFDWGRDIQPWIDVCFENNEGNFLIFIVGTKMDCLTKLDENLMHSLVEVCHDIGTELWVTSAKTDYNVKELFSRVTALTNEVKLATEIEAKAEQARQFQATLNEDQRLKKAGKSNPFQHIIKTLAELKHVQAKKAGKVITQGYIGILHSILNMKRKIKEKINTP